MDLIRKQGQKIKFVNTTAFASMMVDGKREIGERIVAQLLRSLKRNTNVTEMFPRVLGVRCSGTPLIRPPSGRKNLIVLMGWPW